MTFSPKVNISFISVQKNLLHDLFCQRRLLFFRKSLGGKYKHLIDQLILSYKALECNMSLKINILNSHLDYFCENLGSLRDEREIFLIEKRYQGKGSQGMLVDYSRTLESQILAKIVTIYCRINNICTNLNDFCVFLSIICFDITKKLDLSIIFH